MHSFHVSQRYVSCNWSQNALLSACTNCIHQKHPSLYMWFHVVFHRTLFALGVALSFLNCKYLCLRCIKFLNFSECLGSSTIQEEYRQILLWFFYGVLTYCDEILQPPLCMSAHIMEGKLKTLETNQKSEEILHFYLIFCVFMDFYCNVVKGTSMFDWGLLKHGIPESIRFCIGDRPMYTFLVPTHP